MTLGKALWACTLLASTSAFAQDSSIYQPNECTIELKLIYVLR
jgi:hypothetical protein